MEDVLDTWTFDYPHKSGSIFKEWDLNPKVEGYLLEDVTMTATYDPKATYTVIFAADVVTNGLLNNPSCEGGYVDGADKYYVTAGSTYAHDTDWYGDPYPQTYRLVDPDTDLFRDVVAVANDGYEFAG